LIQDHHQKSKLRFSVLCSIFQVNKLQEHLYNHALFREISPKQGTRNAEHSAHLEQDGIPGFIGSKGWAVVLQIKSNVGQKEPHGLNRSELGMYTWITILFRVRVPVLSKQSMFNPAKERKYERLVDFN
jgi:hypothetical protein